MAQFGDHFLTQHVYDPYIGSHSEIINYCEEKLGSDHLGSYSRSKSYATSISENEMNIRNPLCNVRHLNGMLNISLEIFPEKGT